MGLHDPWIMDLGEAMRFATEDGIREFCIPRYGVWEWSENRHKYQVTETSNNLTELQEKFPNATLVKNPRPNS